MQSDDRRRVGAWIVVSWTRQSTTAEKYRFYDAEFCARDERRGERRLPRVTIASFDLSDSTARLRCFGQSKAGHAGLSEVPALDPDRGDLGVVGDRIGKITAVHVIRASTGKSHVRPPGIVPDGKLLAETGEMVETFDERCTEKPFQSRLLKTPG